MPDEKTRGDALRFYLTGATSAGGSQSSPDDSIGGYRSSTEETPLGISITNAISGITIDFAAAANGTGSGTLAATDADTLQWTPPGGSAGAGVSIADGETKIVQGNDTSKWLRVSRTSASNLSGTATVDLSLQYNNVVGFDNVSSSEATAGDDEVRALCGRVVSSLAVLNTELYLYTLGTQQTTDGGQLGASGSGTITTTGSFSDWPDTGYARIEESDGTLREIVFYESRTASALTVPSAGRARMGTSAAAGASDDTVDAVPGIRLALEWGQIAAASFTGSGLDDATSGGTYKLQTDTDYRVEIDATGSPDTFKWSADGGSTWEATGVAITGSAQTLQDGVTVTFGATTGHTVGDYWDIAATAEASSPADEDTIPSGLSWEHDIESAGAIDVGDLESDEQFFVWLRRDVVAGAPAAPSITNQFVCAFDAS